MAVNMNAISVALGDWAAGGDGKLRGNDPLGYEGYTWNPTNLVVTESTATSAPVLTAPADANVTKGATYQGTVVRTQNCHFSLIAGPDDATIDPLTGQVTWSTDASDRAESMYFGVRGDNEHGSDTVFWIVHYGITSGNTKTVGTSKDYATLTAAFQAMNGTVGYTLVVDDGTYDSSTNHDNHIYRSGNTDLDHCPSAGDASNMNTVMARTPYGFVYDCRDLDSHGIHLWGNTDLESAEQALGWSNGGSNIAAGTEQRYIKIAGFVVKNAVSSGLYVYHCDHIYHQYCGDIDSGASQSGTVNVSNMTFQNSTDCLGEYSFAAGCGRYKFTTYQSKRCVYRRGILRNDHYQGTDPVGGVSLYRTKDVRIQNVISIDSKGSYRFRINSTENQGAFGMPSTGVNDYPTNVQFQRGVNLNSAMNFMTQDGYDVDDSDTTVRWTDCVHWDVATEDGMTRDGPATLDRLTAGVIENLESPVNQNSSRFLFSFRARQDINNSIFYNLGWNGSATEDQGPFAYSNYGTNPVTFTDGYRYGFAGDLRVAGDPSLAGYSESGIDTTTNPTTIGLDYLGRVEDGSQLKTEGNGADSTFLYVGKQGTFFGEADGELETTIHSLPRTLTALIAPFFRAYSYTGQTTDAGVETLDGARGFAVVGESLEDYVLGYTGKTPYPSSVQAVNSTGDIHVTWQKPAANYITNITGWKVYVEGTLAATVGASTHGVTLSDDTDIVGVFDVQVVAIDSVTGDSGKSYEVRTTP